MIKETLFIFQSYMLSRSIMVNQLKGKSYFKFEEIRMDILNVLFSIWRGDIFVEKSV